MKFYKPSNKFVLTLLIAVQITFTQALLSQDKQQKIADLVQKYSELGQFNGTVLVAEGDNIIYKGAVGDADKENKIPNKIDTKFRLASITKQFTSALIMQLVEKGKIKLDGKLSEYLPYYRRDIGDKVTISQILSHTAGISNYTDDPQFMQSEVKNKITPRDFVLKFCSGELVFEPGTNWQYSNSGYFILGAVIEEVTGKTYEQMVQENIFTPLGMTNSGYEHSDITYENKAKGYSSLFGEFKPAKFIDMTIPFSAGSLYSTVEDMYKWDRALYTDKILSKESIEKIFTPVLNNYGFGWRIGDQPIGDMKKKVVMHSGGIFGFSSLEIRLVEDKNYIMAFNNTESGSLDQLTLGITNILYGLEPAKPKKSLATELSMLIKEKGIEKAMVEINAAKENKDEYKASEREINQLGYTLLQGGKVNEAVEVLKFNAELYPESANVYDSVAEAYSAAGDKEKAILNYKKSIELDPNNEHGKETLKKLESGK